MNLDKFAADIIEALLKDLGDTFGYVAVELEDKRIEADLYGWKVAKAEALADMLKKFAQKTRVLEAEFDLPDAVLRDYFAGQALASTFEAHHRFSGSSKDAQDRDYQHLAQECYRMANAMLAARNAEPQPAIVEEQK